MRYGHFDDEHREYVITRPDTLLPWINYLGSDVFFGVISNTAGGYCAYRDARLRRITRYRYNNVPADSGGRYIYLRDNGSAASAAPPTRSACATRAAPAAGSAICSSTAGRPGNARPAGTARHNRDRRSGHPVAASRPHSRGSGLKAVTSTASSGYIESPGTVRRGG